MKHHSAWTRDQLLVALRIYCQTPFGRLHSRNPEIVKSAKLIGRTPSALAMKLTNLASIDPAITSTGRKGLAGASAMDREMWHEMHEDWERFSRKSSLAIRQFMEKMDSTSSDTDLDQFADDYTGQEGTAQASYRVGQRLFRQSVLSAYDFRCCITGLAVPELLVASHIVPWRQDEQNRLNPRNGLALSALHDKAFDLGLITISEDMTVVVSTSCRDDDDPFLRSSVLSYNRRPIQLPEKFLPDESFLSYHRATIFRQ